MLDWHRQRTVLEHQRHRGVAEWHPFDLEADHWDSDLVPLAAEPAVATARSLVILEGAYSCRPELHDVLDMRALFVTPCDVRRHQVLDRAGEAHQSE